MIVKLTIGALLWLLEKLNHGQFGHQFLGKSVGNITELLLIIPSHVIASKINLKEYLKKGDGVWRLAMARMPVKLRKASWH